MLALAAVPAKAHESFSELAAALTPSVVNISTTMVVDGQGNNFPTFPKAPRLRISSRSFVIVVASDARKRSVRALSSISRGSSSPIITSSKVADEIRVTLSNDKTLMPNCWGATRRRYRCPEDQPEGEPLTAVSLETVTPSMLVTGWWPSVIPSVWAAR